MGTFGLRLRQERENKRMRLVDVAKSTRVGIHHLAALEHEDFDALPNDVFVKGYIRVYAECLGLDPDSLVKEYLRLAQENRPEQGGNGEDPVLREMSRLLIPEEERGFRLRPRLLAVGGVVVVLAVLVGLWLLGSGDDTVDPVPVQTTPAKGASPPAEPAKVDTRPPAPPEVKPRQLPPERQPAPAHDSTGCRRR